MDDDVEGRAATLSWWRALLNGPAFAVHLHHSGWALANASTRRWIVAEMIAIMLAITAARPDNADDDSGASPGSHASRSSGRCHTPVPRSDTGDAIEKMECVFRRCERPILRQRRAAMKARRHVIPGLAIRGQANFR
jgi:hypothetical protein